MRKLNNIVLSRFLTFDCIIVYNKMFKLKKEIKMGKN
jgi:hypothetical protein